MKETRPRELDSFWHHDLRIGQVRLFGETHDLHLWTRENAFPYRAAKRDIVPLSYSGIHHYLLGQAQIHEEPRPVPPAVARANPDVAARAADRATVRVGDVQAWYYDRDRTAVLWDCMLLNQYREADPALDPNFRALWRGTELLLEQRYPDATRLVTPSWEPAYDWSDWQRFLRTLGYERISRTAFQRTL